MSTSKTSIDTADWTQLLNDPDLVSHLGELLKTYREAPAEIREQALLDTMRKIKHGDAPNASATAKENLAMPTPGVTPSEAPPFEPDIFTPSWGQDRRRYPRMKCFVAVELSSSPDKPSIWGNLANTSMGGAFVETASPVPPGAEVEIGLWLATGKIWVKGFVLSGVVTLSTPQIGVRIRFAEMQAAERETLRQFLKYIESQTKGASQEYGYLAQMKR